MKEKQSHSEHLSLLLFKNTVAILIPAIIVFAVIFWVTYRYPIVFRLSTHPVESLEEMQDWYEKECYNIRMDISALNYTGYDYYENGKQIGAYYYAFMGNECVFFLIRTKEPESTIKQTVVQGKMLAESASMDAMKHEFATAMNLDYETFNALVNPIMVSEIDYSYLEVLLLWLLIIIPYVITGWMILRSVVWTIQPYKHPSTKVLADFGDRRLVYEEIRSQFHNRLVKHNYNYFFTEEYLIISSWWKTDFVRIDFIKYISRHVIQTHHGKKQLYRLTMSNPEKMFYEKDFASEACADEIMAELIRMSPQIDNRTMNIFDLPKPEEEQVVREETQDTKEEA